MLAAVERPSAVDRAAGGNAGGVFAVGQCAGGEGECRGCVRGVPAYGLHCRHRAAVRFVNPKLLARIDEVSML